jgi:hypothetical protein
MASRITERGVTSFRRADGAVVESETRIDKEGVESRVSVTKDGVKESWRYSDSFVDDAKDFVVHSKERVATGETLHEERGFSPALFLAKRGELFADESAGVEFGPLKLTYDTEYTSASLLSSGKNAAGDERHVLSSLGTHAAFPFPGEHWDEGQIAILDDKMEPLLTLRMPEASEEAHLDVRFEDRDGAKHITYQGYMEDDAGKLRFVEAEYALAADEVKSANPSLWERITGAINKAVGFEQRAKLLRELPVPASSLRVDGEEVLKIDSTLGSIDDGARFNNLPNSRLTAINYAPEDSPLIALLDPKEGQARYRFDATLLNDTRGLLHKLVPRFLRQGMLAAHYVVDGKGERHDVDDKLVADGAALSTKHYTWEIDGEPVAIMKRELVRYRDAAGNVELGFRETIVKHPDA